ncbi:hypothetical protein POJ06DRAFT_237437 [Lipomyces tetrasporus]|uniref:WD-like domain-containing protein n=1 Tax=Lipomyces tetrasporus TaxID=54092 RepID=A0AAD7VTB9_9ASCO|nr:uncharacterized protein POJ06DRAFT_237437 [Lipomyces tetrasporus]KAJ8101303.1 hypothetical protein POJ06DRAFT_237437 [Lipomyces tetrasporus]
MCEINANRRLMCIDPITLEQFEYIFHGRENGTILDVFKVVKPGAQFMQMAYGTTDMATAFKEHGLSKRMNWINCGTNSGFMGWFACETSHTIAKQWIDMDVTALNNHILSYVNYAFTYGRDNQSPRATCHVYDGAQFCISWSNYSAHGMYSGEYSDVANFLTSCAMQGFSGEVRVTLIGGAQETICGSNRPDGCTMSPTNC